MWRPESALIKCSIVETDKLESLDIVVHKLVEETFDHKALIIFLLLLSVRINLIPLLIEAFSILKVISKPECKPIPEISMDAWRSFSQEEGPEFIAHSYSSVST